MAIKSQQEVKNAEKAKSEKIPRSMEKNVIVRPQGQDIKNQVIEKPAVNPGVSVESTEKSITERIYNIETYCGKIDQAFPKLMGEIDRLKNIVKIVQDMDSEISKLTGDIVRLTKLEEDRYVELASAINNNTEKINMLDESLPVYITKRIDDYFADLSDITDLTEEQETASEELPTNKESKTP
jgi:hypothetical protein